MLPKKKKQIEYTALFYVIINFNFFCFLLSVIICDVRINDYLSQNVEHFAFNINFISDIVGFDNKCVISSMNEHIKCFINLHTHARAWIRTHNKTTFVEATAFVKITIDNIQFKLKNNKLIFFPFIKCTIKFNALMNERGIFFISGW